MSALARVNSNILILPFQNIMALTDFIQLAKLDQFSVQRVDDTLELATPITKHLEDLIPGAIHWARCRAKEAEEKPKPPTGPGGNPDGTPPGGGTPGTPVLDRYTYTEARAA